LTERKENLPEEEDKNETKREEKSDGWSITYDI